MTKTTIVYLTFVCQTCKRLEQTPTAPTCHDKEMIEVDLREQRQMGGVRR